MNKTMKILSCVLLAIMIIATVSNVFAVANIMTDIEQGANNTTTNMSAITPTVGRLVKTVRNASVIIGVGIIIILGIKYMLGSVEEKSGYQKSFIPLIVGIVVVMSATSIASFLFGVLE